MTNTLHADFRHHRRKIHCQHQIRHTIQLAHAVRETQWLPDLFRNPPLNYPPLLLAWIQAWGNDNNPPETLKLHKQQGLDNNAILEAMLSIDGGLQAVRPGRVNGVRSLLYRYFDEIGQGGEWEINLFGLIRRISSSRRI